MVLGVILIILSTIALGLVAVGALINLVEYFKNKNR